MKINFFRCNIQKSEFFALYMIIYVPLERSKANINFICCFDRYLKKKSKYTWVTRKNFRFLGTFMKISPFRIGRFRRNFLAKNSGGIFRNSRPDFPLLAMQFKFFFSNYSSYLLAIRFLIEGNKIVHTSRFHTFLKLFKGVKTIFYLI